MVYLLLGVLFFAIAFAEVSFYLYLRGKASHIEAKWAIVNQAYQEAEKTQADAEEQLSIARQLVLAKHKPASPVLN